MTTSGKGWTQKSNKWIDRLLKFTKQLDNKVIAVGFPMGKCRPYPTGESVAAVARKNIMGDGVKKRDFMAYAKPMIEQRTKPLLVAMAKAPPEEAQALAKAAGMEAANAIKDAILNGEWPENSDMPMSAMLREDLERQWDIEIPEDMGYKSAKLKFKKKDKPLVLSSHMVNSVTYDVRDKT